MIALIDVIQRIWGIQVVQGDAPSEAVEQVFLSLKRIPYKVAIRCGVSSISFSDLGESKEYYPNHGVYRDDGTIELNYRMLEDPKLWEADGQTLNRFEHTLIHEMGHGFDMVMGGGEELSLKPEWLELSSWSEKPIPGYRRLVVKEGDYSLKGEWYYKAGSEFVRFYASRNPWDDFADSFAFHFAGLTSMVPASKVSFLEAKVRR